MPQAIPIYKDESNTVEIYPAISRYYKIEDLFTLPYKEKPGTEHELENMLFTPVNFSHNIEQRVFVNQHALNIKEFSEMDKIGKIAFSVRDSLLWSYQSKYSITGYLIEYFYNPARVVYSCLNSNIIQTLIEFLSRNKDDIGMKKKDFLSVHLSVSESWPEIYIREKLLQKFLKKEKEYINSDLKTYMSRYKKNTLDLYRTYDHKSKENNKNNSYFEYTHFKEELEWIKYNHFYREGISKIEFVPEKLADGTYLIHLKIVTPIRNHSLPYPTFYSIRANAKTVKNLHDTFYKG